MSCKLFFSLMVFLFAYHFEGQQLKWASLGCVLGLHKGVTTASLGIIQLQGHLALVINDHMSGSTAS